MNIPTPKQAVDSIISWTNCDAMPSDANLRLEYYARQILLIQNAARAIQFATEIEFPGALERNGLKEPAYVASSEFLESLTGLHKALSRMIEKYEPYSLDAEWLSHSNEVIRKITGHDAK